ncbi:MAG: TatD family hydrolase [Alphaproteobacteria bacterium]|nr:TatD family hydrolase [Alphaproteobacteria bacterium]
MFDAHNHLDLCGDPALALAEATKAGVLGHLVAGVDPAGWQRQCDLAVTAPQRVFLALGLHPWAVARLDDDAVDAALAALPAALDGALGARPVALGELGLDRSRAVPADSRSRQRRAFRHQLALARAVDLPVVLHIVRAHGEALEILRSDGLPSSGGMVHSASTPADLVPAFLSLGLHLSFAGNVTRHDKARAAAACVPLDRLLAETDAPDQPPAGHDAPNRPALLPEIVAALAAVHAVPAERLGRHCADNARRLFRLPPASLHG